MAPLTWRNVDGPNFSGANDMWKIAATLMSQGFDSARRGINDFRDITTDEQSSALMQKIIAAGNDPAAIAAATAGANAAYLSPEALTFANNQPGVLLDREGKALANVGEGLNNTIRSQSIRASDYNFGRTVLDNQRADANYDLLPEANAAFTNLRNNIANGTLTGDAKVAAEADFVSKYGRALGINSAAELGSFITNNQTAFTTQQNQNIAAIQNDETLTGLVRGKDAKGIAANILSRYPDYATAQRALQSWSDIDPALKVDALKALETLAPAAVPKTPAQIEAESNAKFRGVIPTGAQPLPGSYQEFQRGTSSPLMGLIDSYQPVIMQNTGKRNLPLNSNLNAALQSVLPNLGLTAVVTSGGQVTAEEAARGEGQRTGSTRHDHGGAADVKFRTADGRTLSWERPADVPLLQAAVSGLKAQGLTGFGAAGDYMGAETTHIGYGTPAVWGAKGGKPYQALLDAYNNTQTVASSGSGPTVERAAAANNAPAYQAAMDAITQNQTYQAPINPNTPVENILTTEIGGAWFNIPTVVDGKELPEEQALAEFRRGMNPAVGVFQSKRDAERAAEERTNTLDEMLQEQTAGVVNETAAASQQQSDAITAAATPTVANTVPANDRTKEIKVNDRWTIPAVDPKASQARQDWQNSQRNLAISGVLESIKTDLATSQGGGPLASWAGGTWDYFMADPATARDNASAREGAKEALSWYNSEVAKKYFRENPDALVEAAANPIQFQQNFGKTQTQANQTAQPTTATNSTQGNQTTTTTKSGLAVTPPSQATASSVDMALSKALSTSAMDTANNQSLGLINSIQSMENSNESPPETANRLTDKEKGPLRAYPHRAVTAAIEEIMTATGVNAAVAGQILQMNGVARYNTGWVPGTDQGFGSGYEINKERAQEIWNTYVNRAKKGVESANEGAARLIMDDLSQAQRAELSALQTQYREREARIKALIAEPTTTDADRALLRQELQNLYSFMQERVNSIMDSGRLTPNLAARTGQ